MVFFFSAKIHYSCATQYRSYDEPLGTPRELKETQVNLGRLRAQKLSKCKKKTRTALFPGPPILCHGRCTGPPLITSNSFFSLSSSIQRQRQLHLSSIRLWSGDWRLVPIVTSFPSAIVVESPARLLGRELGGVSLPRAPVFWSEPAGSCNDQVLVIFLEPTSLLP